uniref:Uncharacterized protein n=1 Tax=Ditylenchus dipsaci TaxID=166011 RepID=A0A915CLC0_9BILA
MGIRRFTSSGVSKSCSLPSSSASSSSFSPVESRIYQHNRQHQQQRNDAAVDNLRHSTSSNNNGTWTNTSTSSQHPTSNNNNSTLREVNAQAMQRIQALELDNRRIMSNQGKLIGESNRRLDMHLNEIRLLKEEVKTLKSSNQELRLEKQKIQQLSHEWESFGRYINQLMKQEINVFQSRANALEAGNEALVAEKLNSNASAYAGEAELSEDAGCGSSAVSSSGSDLDNNRQPTQPVNDDTPAIMTNSMICIQNQEKEKTLRTIADQMSSSTCHAEKNDGEKGPSTSTQGSQNERVFDYIRSLENRIRQLEHCESRSFQAFSSAFNSPYNSLQRTVAQRQQSPFSRLLPKLPTVQSQQCKLPIHVLSNVFTKPSLFRMDSTRAMGESTAMISSNCTMTSSGTTYCSSEADESAAATTIIQVGDESFDTALFDHLEVRSLGTILEEEDSGDKDVERAEPQEQDQAESSVEMARHQTSPPEPLVRTRLMPKEDHLLEEDGCSNAGSANSNRISSSSTYSASSSNFSAGSSFSNNHSYADGDGRPVEDVDCLDMDLPPRMPLLSETNRFSVCSTSDLSLDNFSIHSNSSSRQSDKATTKAAVYTSLPKAYHSPILERKAMVPGNIQQPDNSLNRIALTRIAVPPNIHTFRREINRVANTACDARTGGGKTNSLERLKPSDLSTPVNNSDKAGQRAKMQINNIVNEGHLIQAHFTSL